MLPSLIAIALMQSSAAEAAEQRPALMSPCQQDPAFAAFDFWLGEWDVYRSDGEAKVADSRIERPGAGCGVIETWRPLAGPGGDSVSNYNPATGRWHQKWVGSAPGLVTFEGGPVGNGMVLTGYWPDIGGPGREGLVRMTYIPQPDGSVRQHGMVSYDHGINWADSFDLTYRRKKDGAK